jgi:cerevisin
MHAAFAGYTYITENPAGYQFGNGCLDFPNTTVCFLEFMPQYIPAYTRVHENLWALKADDKFWFEMEEGEVFPDTAFCQEEAPWHLARITQKNWSRNNLKFPYSFRDGSGVDVYVLDTWADVNHPQFNGRATRLRSFQAHDPKSFPMHGTHCMGLVNSQLYGVAKRSNLFSVQVLADDGTGDYEGIIKALHYVYERAKGKPSVVSLSLGGPKFSLLDRLLEQMMDNGLVVVAAAGNDNVDAQNSSPGSANVVVVGATDLYDRKSDFSNFGPTVKVYAPGTSILSLCPEDRTCWMSGTSMATPIVAGTVATVWSKNLSLRGRMVWRELDKQTQRGKIKDLPEGSVNKILYLNNGEC